MPSDLPSLNVWDWAPGMTVQVTQTFRDFDAQEICAGETLHLVDKNFFPYDEGHTLIFTEKTIRLCGNVPEDGAIVVNKDNSHFRVIPDTASLLATWKHIIDYWTMRYADKTAYATQIRDEVDQCGAWLLKPEPRGPAPVCTCGELATATLIDDLARQICFLFAGVRVCGPASVKSGWD